MHPVHPRRLRWPAVLSLLLLTPLASGGTLHVPGNFPTIQDALAAAQDGDVIIVAPGSYHELVDTLGKAVTVRSSDPDDPAVVAATIVDGKHHQRVVRIHTGEGRDTVLEGLTLFNGRAFNGNGYDGGGLYLEGSSPTFSKCVVTGNLAEGSEGGGGFLLQSGAHFVDCLFEDNEAESGSGGALALEASDALIERCTFRRNLTVGASGAAIALTASSARIERCTFVENLAQGGDGGAVREQGGGSLVLACEFVGNVAYLGVGGGGAGRVGASTWYVNCRFADNDSGMGSGVGARDGALNVVGCEFVGGTINGPFGGTALGCMEQGSLVAVACTIVDNRAGGAVQLRDSGALVLRNSIVWSNLGAEIENLGTGTLLVEYCDVDGGFAGAGNIDQQPHFVSKPERDFRLTAGSPCVDVGLAALLPNDVFDLDGDKDFGEPLPFDLGGHDRVVGPEVDMGADEYEVVLLGQNYCGPAALNSSGQSGVISATGRDEVWWNEVTLSASGLPAHQFGYFLASQTQGFVPFAGGSQGHLCLGGTIGRFRAQVQDSGPAGEYSMELDLTAFPPPLPPAVQPGETWNFQSWFRDVNPTPTSNFTDGLELPFQ